MQAIKGRDEKIFNVFNNLFLLLVGVICLFPFVNVLAKSLSSEGYVVAGEVWLLPKGFNVKAYTYILTNNEFWKGMRNSAYVTIVGSALNTILTLFVAYAVSRNYFATIPDSIEESAKMDGAGNIHILIKIMTPLALPCLATVALFVMVGYWNDYFGPLLYITSTKFRTLQVFLRSVVNAAKDVNMNDFDALNELSLETIRGATVFAATLPILLVYPFLQKYFVTGATVGAVKQ